MVCSIERIQEVRQEVAHSRLDIRKPEHELQFLLSK